MELNLRRVRFLLLSMLSLTALSLSAAEVVIEDAVVKVLSGSCHDSARDFRGSGLLFSDGEQVYALTSEHILLQANAPFCHQVRQSDGSLSAAQLLAADWGTGLALLRVELKHADHLPTFESLIGQDATNGEEVKVWGFPYSSDTLFTHDRGRVLAAKSPRGMIALVTHMLELVETHGEFGMSGGPISSADGQRFFGVLSHQYLKVLPGKPSKVLEFDQEEAEADHLFAIPANVALAWVKRILREKNAAPTFVRDPLLQMQGINTVFSTGLKFSWLSKPSGEIGGGNGVGTGGGNGVGTGGGNGVGTGGGNGVGTGGDSNTINVRNDRAWEGVNKEIRTVIGDHAAIEISLDHPPHAAHWDFKGRKSWFNDVRARTLRQGRVFVPFFLKRGQGNEMPQKVSFSNLGDFVRLLTDETLIPVTILQGNLQQDRQRFDAAEMEELKTDGAWLMGMATATATEINASDSLEARQLLAQIKLVGQLLAGEQWLLIDEAWIKELAQGHTKGWAYLFRLDEEKKQEEMIELMRKIIKIERTLARARL